jgi:heat shock protein HtpX
MLKRIGLFALVNLMVMITISLVLNILGLNHYLTSQGIHYPSLLAFCLIYGMVGSFISLMLSKKMAQWTMNLRMIPPTSVDPLDHHLVATVRRLSQSAGLTVVPEVAIYDSPEINAFATGPSRSNSLVAVSTGLLNRMSEPEVEGVLAHEVAHIANGDMVTMTLIQGVVNAFVMFISKTLAWLIAQGLTSQGDDGESGEASGGAQPSFFMILAIESVLYVVFGLLGSLVVAWFSRYREFRADAGGAATAGSHNMIAALQRLQTNAQLAPEASGQGASHDQMASLKIFGRSSWSAWFSTHPPLELRIARLKEAALP